jgi:hypothetical protein
MAKTKEQLLADYIKSNKVRREAIAKKAGFGTGAEYRAYLSGIKVEKKAKVKEVAKAETAVGAEPTDIVVAFDTTGSMSAYIGAVRKHVAKLIGDLFSNTPNLRMKIVAFGDYCDMKSTTLFGIAYQETALTDNQNDLIRFVQDASNTSGGDGDEFYELVIKKVVEETAWRDGKKSVLLIGDANPHYVGYSYLPFIRNSQIDWRKEGMKAASLNIQFDTLRINSAGWYKELSDMTNGVCVDFKSANKIGEIIEGTTYARSSKTIFMAKMDAAVKSGDEELIGAYKTMSSLL